MPTSTITQEDQEIIMELIDRGFFQVKDGLICVYFENHKVKDVYSAEVVNIPLTKKRELNLE
jgi:hypothetical protein